METNRITTKPLNIVDPAGRVVSSEPLPVTFEKSIRMVIDRKRNNGARVSYTQVICDGCVRAWIIDVPTPSNMPAGPALCVGGYYSPEGEQILTRGTRLAVESALTEFARTAALNEIQNQITGS